MWDKHNYVDFSDTDSQLDYFNGYCLSIRQTIDWMKRDGGDVIVVKFGNGCDSKKYRKRLAAICKQCGYLCEEMRKEIQISHGENWLELWFVLTKNRISDRFIPVTLQHLSHDRPGSQHLE